MLLLLSQGIFSTDLAAEENRSIDNSQIEIKDAKSDSSSTDTIHECLFCLDYGRLLLQDTRYVLSSPARWERQEWLYFSLGVAGIGATALLDKPIRDGVQRNRNGTTDRIANIFEPFGAEYSFGILGGFYLAGTALHNPKAIATAQDGLGAGLIASGIITPALKVAIGRQRPSQGKEVYSLRPFSGNESFPSGHTTQAFAVASVISAHYDPLWVKMTAYGVAGLVGFARIDHNAHFASDVAAGALIGTAVGKAIFHFNQQKRGQQGRTHISFVPLISQDTEGIVISFNF